MMTGMKADQVPQAASAVASASPVARPAVFARVSARALAVAVAAVVACFAVLAAQVVMPQQAYAADAPTTSSSSSTSASSSASDSASSPKDSTLTIINQYKGKGIPGAGFTAYQIARIASNGAYELLDDFSGVGIDLNAGVKSADMLSAAKKMAAIVKAKGLKGITATTDSNGKASFGTLDQGVYLVVQTDSKGEAAKYSKADPFLINVPQFTDDEIVYDVVAKPKPRILPVTPTTPHKPTPSKPNPFAKTGDPYDVRIALICFVVGLAAMVVALFTARKKHE